jgi:hypothetical protein
MAKRTRDTEQEFGSDSFLDIVANMVGILIILIVVAGVRVSQSSLEPAPVDAPPEIVTDLPGFGTSEASPWVVRTPDAPLAPEVPSPILVDLTPPDQPELRARHQQQQLALRQLAESKQKLLLSIASVRAEQRTTESKLRQSADTGRVLEQKFAAARDRFVREQQLRESLVAEREAAAREAAAAERKLAAARDDLAMAARSDTAAEVLQHELTPVSELIRGKELHFHLNEGRVAMIPIDSMMNRIRSQIEAKREWLLKSNAVHGNIGPIDGFKMRYLLQRENLTPLEELRMGAGMVRVGLREWTIEPDTTLRAETVAQATQPGSQFELTLRAASLDTTCTFWVYPDSFAEFQQLQKMVRKYNLRVAGRPLPDGIPITGSPNGSRSAAQ